MSALFIDAHCHLADERLYSRLDEVFSVARARRIGAFVQGGVCPAEWDRQRELAARFPGILFPCFGLHPWFVAGRLGVQGEELKAQIQKGLELLPQYLSRRAEARALQGVAIGELGIDLGPKTDPSTADFQKAVFAKQLEIAQQLKKPLVLHIVKAHSEGIRILSEHGPYPQGGLVHAFTGSYEIAQEYVRLGFTLSIGGVAARPGYENLKKALKKISLDQIVIESDSPDQIPEGFRGLEEGMNDPRSLWTVAEAICRLRGEPLAQAEQLLAGSRDRLIRIFGLEL